VVERCSSGGAYTALRCAENAPTVADDIAEGLTDKKGWKRLARARQRSGGGTGESSSSEGPRRIDCGGGGGGVPVLQWYTYMYYVPPRIAKAAFTCYPQALKK